MIRIGAGYEDGNRLLTVSQRFEENPQQFCSTKAHHGGVVFRVGSEEDKGPGLLVRSLCVWSGYVAITPASRHPPAAQLGDMWDGNTPNR